MPATMAVSMLTGLELASPDFDRVLEERMGRI
jgi:hypothetical protein